MPIAIIHTQSTHVLSIPIVRIPTPFTSKLPDNASQAQRMEEVQALRSRVREAESTATDTEQREILLKEQVGKLMKVLRLTTWQLAALKAEIRRMERNVTRGSANLEYLKNIFVKFLESSANRDKYVIDQHIFEIFIQ